MNTVMMIHPLLPSNLWPHSFLILSLSLAVFLGFFSIGTLLATIPATILAYLVSANSQLGTGACVSCLALADEVIRFLKCYAGSCGF